MPTAVGRYRIDRVLGQGAFASVWLGLDDDLNDKVAIKVLSGALLDDLDVRNRFLEEARILRRADSERLVRVHEFGELPDGRPYFVMSYADRGSLADRMGKRPLPVSETLGLVEEIANGVEVINQLGVIHRDLKPSNILFQTTKDGLGERLLIADLGLAKALAHASGAFTLPVGTPGYMSPEQARFGGGLDVRADVYGIGALTYHLLSGRAPGPAPIRVPPSQHNPEVTPAIDAVVLKALAGDRERRWPTAAAYAAAIAGLRRGEAPASPPPPVLPPNRQQVNDQQATQLDLPAGGFEPYARIGNRGSQDDIPTGRYEAVDPDKTAAVQLPRDADATFLDQNALLDRPQRPVQPPANTYQPPPSPPDQYSGPPTPTAPPPPRKANSFLIPAVIVAGVLLIGAVAAVLVKLSGGGTDTGNGGKDKPPPSGMTVLTDASQKISVAVPQAWKQDPEASWNPVENNLADADTTRPVLRASTDPANFRPASATSPGIFIGLTSNPNVPPAVRANHALKDNGTCTKGQARTKTVGTLTFTITPWTGCQQGVPMINEIGVKDSANNAYAAWIRIKLAAGDDPTDKILDTVKLSAP